MYVVAHASVPVKTVKERFGEQGADATFLPPEEFVAFMKAEWAKWGPVVKATGARVD